MTPRQNFLSLRRRNCSTTFSSPSATTRRSTNERLSDQVDDARLRDVFAAHLADYDAGRYNPRTGSGRPRVGP